MWRILVEILESEAVRTLSDRSFRAVVWMIIGAAQGNGYIAVPNVAVCRQLQDRRVTDHDEEGWYFRKLRSRWRELFRRRRQNQDWRRHQASGHDPSDQCSQQS
jgi:hypothetical protein